MSRKKLSRYVKLRVPRAVKRVTNPLIGRVRIPIASGVNRGLKWSLASAGSGYGSGRRAALQMEALASLMRAGDVVWDVGAHHGYVTLCASPRVGPAGQVHAFEPSETNRWFLHRHVAWNGLRNVSVHPYALSDYDGEASFGGRSTSKRYHLGGGEERVAVRSTRSLIESGSCPAPSFLKIDVEGAEAGILADALPVLGSDTRMLVAVHSPEIWDACVALLDEAGYRMAASRQAREYRAGRWRGDADLFCCGPGWAAAEQDLAMLERIGF